MTITVVWHISFDGIWLVRIDLGQRDGDEWDDDGDENCCDDENGGDEDQNDGQDHDSDPDDDGIAWSCSLTLCALLSDQIGRWSSGSAGPVERERASRNPAIFFGHQLPLHVRPEKNQKNL